MNIIGIIPARYASDRFPGKVLVDIDGLSMVQRVYQQASQAPSLTQVVVATDHQEIHDHVKSFGGEVCMTGDHHRSGTERCQEALDLQQQEFDFVVNIQGDEPFIKPEQIEDLASQLNEQVQIATLAKKITDPQLLLDPNLVKVIVNHLGQAQYFSRSPLPYHRNLNTQEWLRHHDYFGHVGIYAYGREVLAKITSLPVAPWEQAEGLEQLRWLYHGYAITVFQTEYESLGIDTPEDLQRALKSQAS